MPKHPDYKSSYPALIQGSNDSHMRFESRVLKFRSFPRGLSLLRRCTLLQAGPIKLHGGAQIIIPPLFNLRVGNTGAQAQLNVWTYLIKNLTELKPSKWLEENMFWSQAQAAEDPYVKEYRIQFRCRGHDLLISSHQSPRMQNRHPPMFAWSSLRHQRCPSNQWTAVMRLQWNASIQWCPHGDFLVCTTLDIFL